VNLMSHACVNESATSISVSLLVSDDTATINRITQLMLQLAIATEVCSEAGTARGLMEHRQFGAVIVDLQLGNQARWLIQKIRRSPSNRTAVVFAIGDSDAEAAAAFGEGATFVLRRPLSECTIERSLRAGYGLILREQRRYFRCPIDVPAILRCGLVGEVLGRTVNISEGGIAVAAAVSWKPGAEVQAEFRFPGHDLPFVGQSIICWYSKVRIGLRFTSLSLTQHTQLREWLSCRLEQSLPDSVAAKFRSLRLR
jgi:ActR/RegA family two-component response regulator